MSFQQNLQNKPFGHEQTIYKHISLISLSNFWYQILVAASGNFGGKMPVVNNVFSSHKQDFPPSTSHDENCKEFEIQTDRNYCVDLKQPYLALKLNFAKCHGYETLKTKEVKRQRKDKAKTDGETE